MSATARFQAFNLSEQAPSHAHTISAGSNNSFLLNELGLGAAVEIRNSRIPPISGMAPAHLLLYLRHLCRIHLLAETK